MKNRYEPNLFRAEGEDIPLRGLPTEEKPCLKCEKPFESTHKFNRLCKKCKERADPDETRGGINFRFSESLTSERPNYY